MINSPLSPRPPGGRTQGHKFVVSCWRFWIPEGIPTSTTNSSYTYIICRRRWTENGRRKVVFLLTQPNLYVGGPSSQSARDPLIIKYPHEVTSCGLRECMLLYAGINYKRLLSHTSKTLCIFLFFKDEFSSCSQFGLMFSSSADNTPFRVFSNRKRKRNIS